MRVSVIYAILCFHVEAGRSDSPISEIELKTPQEQSEFAYSLGLGAAYGQYSATIPGIPRVADHVLSSRGDLELRLGSYWMDIRYERLETDLATLGNFRSLLGARKTMIPQLEIFGGFGYGYQTNEIDIVGNELVFGGDELLLNVGLRWEGSPFLMTLEYIHCVSRASKARYKLTRVSFSEEHIGSLEASLGFNIHPKVSTRISVETQLGGGTVIEKDWALALGISYAF